MFRSFRSRLVLGFSATIGIAILIGGVALYSLSLLTRAKDIVTLDYAQDVITVQDAYRVSEKTVANSRGYLISGDPSFLEKLKESRANFSNSLERLRSLSSTDEGRRMVEKVDAAAKAYQSSVDQVVALRKDRASPSIQAIEAFEEDLQPKRELLEETLASFADYKKNQLEEAQDESVQLSSRVMLLVLLIAIAVILFATVLAVTLSRALTGMYRRAEEATKMREDVLAIVSHDLKNPLTAISLKADLLMRSAQRSNDTEEFFQKQSQGIKDNATWMRRMIDALLDVAKIEAGRFSVETQSSEVAPILQNVVQFFEQEAASKSIRIEVLQSDPAWVMCDSDRIVQVLSNFVGNSIKFTAMGGLISLRSTTLRDEVVFAVQDTGPGIPEEHLPHVFDRYWQAKLTAKKGTGLGLAIAKGIVEAHGGRVWVESKVGEGSTFYFSVPRSEPVATDQKLQPGILKRQVVDRKRDSSAG